MSMYDALGFLLIPALSLALTLGLTPLAMRIAQRLGMLDMPDLRRIHTLPVPRAGGLAVFAGFHAACAAVYVLPWSFSGGFTTELSWLKLLGLTALLLAAGLWDDRFGMSAAAKLAWHGAVGALAYVLGFRLGAFFGFGLPVWLDLPGTAVWFIAFINAFNLIDGMDGLATGLAAIAAGGLAGAFLIAGQPGDCLVMLALAGACLGFLRYNFNPARVFLGDTGSMFLGCTLAALALNTGSKSTTFTALAVPLLSVGIPLFDTFLAVWRRLARKVLKKDGGAAVFGADIDHLHHRLLKTGLSQRRAAALLYAGSLALVGVALLSQLFASRALGLYMIMFVAGVYIIIRHIATIEMWTTGMALMKGINRPGVRHLSVPLYMACDLLALAAANLAAQLLIGHWSGGRAELASMLLDKALPQVGITFLCLAVGARVYRRVWRMAGAMDYASLVLWTVLGILLGCGWELLFGAHPRPKTALYAAVLYLGLALVPLLSLHSFMRIVLDWLSAVQVHGKSADRGTPVLVFGAAHYGRLLSDGDTGIRLNDGRAVAVKGFFDTDANLHGRLVQGIKVFGGLGQLEDSIRKTSARALIVIQELSRYDWLELRHIAEQADIAVWQWQPQIRNAAALELPGARIVSLQQRRPASDARQRTAARNSDMIRHPSGAPGKG